MTCPSIAGLPDTITIQLKTQAVLTKTSFAQKVQSIRIGPLSMEYEVDIDSFKKVVFRCKDSRVAGVTKQVVFLGSSKFHCDA